MSRMAVIFRRRCHCDRPRSYSTTMCHCFSMFSPSNANVKQSLCIFCGQHTHTHTPTSDWGRAPASRLRDHAQRRDGKQKKGKSLWTFLALTVNCVTLKACCSLCRWGHGWAFTCTNDAKKQQQHHQELSTSEEVGARGHFGQQLDQSKWTCEQ